MFTVAFLFYLYSLYVPGFVDQKHFSVFILYNRWSQNKLIVLFHSPITLNIYNLGIMLEEALRDISKLCAEYMNSLCFFWCCILLIVRSHTDIKLEVTLKNSNFICVYLGISSLNAVKIMLSKLFNISLIVMRDLMCPMDSILIYFKRIR